MKIRNSFANQIFIRLVFKSNTFGFDKFNRITFYNTGKIKAEEGHLYSLKIPESMRGQGDEYDILIEVTLAFTSQVRRTRQKIKSYLSTWLDWSSSKIDEPFDKFKDYILKEINGSKTNYDKEERKKLPSYNWYIKNRIDKGKVLDISRSNSSLQKDWTILKSYELPEEISFAICGHRGWDKNKIEIPYAITVSLEILGANIPIYEDLRIENEIGIETEV